MKWKNEMDSLGLNENNISVGLKNKINDYKELENAIKETETKIENPSLNDDVDDLQADLREFKEAIEIADVKLVRAIQVFDKNKDKYAEMSKRLTGRPRKDGQPRKQTQNPAPAPKPAEPPVHTPPVNEPTSTQVVSASSSTQVDTNDDNEGNKDGEKKKTNWWLFGGAILLCAVTFGLYKARD